MRYAAQPAPAHIGLRLSVAVGRRRVACLSGYFIEYVPGPPTCATATAGIGEATVSFKPQKSDGGSPIIRYTVTSHPGKIKASGKQSPITVIGLSNGKAYTFTVSASCSSGTGLASEPSNSVTPKAE